MTKNILNIIFLIILLIILLYYLINKNMLETFINVFGTDSLVNMGNCTPENNCYPGNYLRTQIYQNVCQPKYGLLRQKIPLNDNCQRSLMNVPKYYYKCHINKHLQRNCSWYKK